MRQEMRLSQRLQLLDEGSCDYGIEPIAGTKVRLRLRIESVLRPVVTFRRGNKKMEIVFRQGYDPKVFLADDQQGICQDWLLNAQLTVMFEQDSTTGVVLLAVCYKNAGILEHVIDQEELTRFLRYPYDFAHSDVVEDQEDDWFIERDDSPIAA